MIEIYIDTKGKYNVSYDDSRGLIITNRSALEVLNFLSGFFAGRGKVYWNFPRLPLYTFERLSFNERGEENSEGNLIEEEDRS